MKIQLFSIYYQSDNQRNNFDNSYENFDNIGVGRIAAFLMQRNVEVEVTYLNAMDLEGAYKLVDKSCDLFGFSVYNNCADFIFEVARMIKEDMPNALVFLGSKFATETADILLNECRVIDFIVLGYGEFPIYDIVTKLNLGYPQDDIYKNSPSIMSQKYRANKVFCNTDIKELPWPDRSNLDAKNGMVAYICSSHGCIASCTFCSVSNNHAKWSGRNANDIFDEIVAIYEMKGIRFFAFTDGSIEDPGTQGKEKLKELCRLLVAYPIRFAFRCFIRAETFKDTKEDCEILELMRKAGFTTVIIGIESGNEEDLRLYSKRATVIDNREALVLFAKHDIKPLFGFIMMNPFSDEERLKKNFKFLSEHKDFHLDDYINSLRIFHNTPIHKSLKLSNNLLEDYSFRGYYDYKFENEYVKQVFDFLRTYFHDRKTLTVKDLEFWNFIHLFKRIHTVCKDIGSLPTEVEGLQQELAYELTYYFMDLYDKKSIDACIANYPDFEEKMMKIYSKSNKVKMKLLKYYITQNITMLEHTGG